MSQDATQEHSVQSIPARQTKKVIAGNLIHQQIIRLKGMEEKISGQITEEMSSVTLEDFTKDKTPLHNLTHILVFIRSVRKILDEIQENYFQIG